MIVYDHNDSVFYSVHYRKGLLKTALPYFTEDFREFLRQIVYELNDRNMLIDYAIRYTGITFRWRTFAGEVVVSSFDYETVREWVNKPHRFLNKFIYRME